MHGENLRIIDHLVRKIANIICVWGFFPSPPPPAQSHGLSSSVSYSNPSTSPPRSPSHPPPFLSSNLFPIVRSDDANHVFDHALSWFLFFLCYPSASSKLFSCSVPYPLFLFVSVSPCQSICMHIYVQMHIHTHTHANLQNLANVGVTLSNFFFRFQSTSSFYSVRSAFVFHIPSPMSIIRTITVIFRRHLGCLASFLFHFASLWPSWTCLTRVSSSMTQPCSLSFFHPVVVVFCFCMCVCACMFPFPSCVFLIFPSKELQ